MSFPVDTSHKPSVVALLFALVLVARPCVALGDPSPAPAQRSAESERVSPACRAAGQAWLVRARELVREAHLSLARDAYRKSLAQEPTTEAWLELGDCYDRLYQSANSLHAGAKAVGAYREAEALALTKGDSTSAKAARERAAAVLARMGVASAIAPAEAIDRHLNCAPPESGPAAKVASLDVDHDVAQPPAPPAEPCERRTNRDPWPAVVWLSAGVIAVGAPIIFAGAKGKDNVVTAAGVATALTGFAGINVGLYGELIHSILNDRRRTCKAVSLWEVRPAAFAQEALVVEVHF